MLILRPFLLIVLTLAVLAPVPPAGPFFAGTAWADDDGDDGDDDGGDDDGGDDDGGDDRSDRPAARGHGARRAGAARAAPRAPAPPPLAAPDEIVSMALTSEDLSRLTALGYLVVEEAPTPLAGAPLRRLRIPPGVALAEALVTVRSLPSGQNADLNHYYRPEAAFADDCQGADCPARRILGWPQPGIRAAACGSSVAVGMIDTGINAGHAAFVGAALVVRRLSQGGIDPSRAIHGTAVAGLLVGDPNSRSPGLVPGSPLFAVDAFHRAGSDERADAFSVIAGLGLLADSGARVVNLSLAGPDNMALAEAVDALVTGRDIVVVSAVGNDGPSAAPAFPAAYPQVIAVTATDRAGNVYRRAGRGSHVDIAAPGVDVWTAASVSGARWKTGTSFAAPFVTAAAAILREEQPSLSALEVGMELRRRATDLGPPGIDEVFGAGLVNLGGACRGRT